MSRRSLGTQSAAGARDARARLAATLGASPDGVNPDSAYPDGVNPDSAVVRDLAWDAEPPGVPAGAVGAAAAAGRATRRSSPGLLDAPGLIPALPHGLPTPPLSTASPDGDGRRSADNADDFPGGRHGRWREGRAPLSAWLRARTGVRAAVLLGVLAAVLGCFFWWQAATGGAEVVPLTDAVPVAAEEAAATASASSVPPGEEAGTGPGNITVHVAGAVTRPGVVQLPAGSRLHEAVTAAGGATDMADAGRLNLAAVLEDGQKVLVPVRGEPDQAGPPVDGTAVAPGSGANGTGGGGKVNLNTADVEQLGTLPRVGPVLAKRIVDWREQHGRFKSAQELDAVEGIGPKLLATLLPLVGI